jgi:flagellar protein FliO/FliZ
VNAVELIGRMLLALLVVLGLMWAIAKFARRPLVGKGDRVMDVLARQQLNRNASVAVVKVMDRALVLGVTDNGVRLLSETELAPIEAVLSSDRPRRTRAGAHAAPVSMSVPAGSLAAASTITEQPHVDFEPVTHPAAHGTATTYEIPSLGVANTAAPVRAAESKGALDGSILSPKVWSQLVSAARDVTVRR